MPEVNNRASSRPGLLLPALKLVFLLGALGFFLYGIVSTYAFVVYLQEDTVDDFMDGTFDLTGLNSTDDTVTLLPIGLTGDWDEDDNPLDVPLTDLAAVASGDRIFVVGGVDDLNHYRTEIYSTTVMGDHGELSGWTTLSGALPVGLGGHQAVIDATTEHTSTIYVLGGQLEASDSVDTVYRIVISNTTGGLVGDVITSAVHLPDALHYHSALISNGKIYVLGGLHFGDGDYASSSVSHASILTGGVLSGFTYAAALPGPLYSSAAVLYAGSMTDTVYLMGGEQADDVATLKVLVGDIISSTGEVDSWRVSGEGNLPVPVWSHAGVIVNNGNLFVLGGRTGVGAEEVVSSTVKSALADEDDPARIYDWRQDGSPDNRWLGEVGERLLQPRSGAAAVQCRDYIYVMGGVAEKAGNAKSTVFRGGVGGAGGEVLHYYAPEGSYASNTIDLDEPHQSQRQIKGLSWRAYITGTNSMSLTMEYRSWNSGNPPAWQPANPSQESDEGNEYQVYTASLPMADARYFQYKADMSTMSNTQTPRLDWVRIYFDVPDPDLQVSKSGPDEVSSTQAFSYTIYYTATGGVPAANAVLTETVPENTSYVPSEGWNQVGESVVYTYSLGTVGTTGSSTEDGSVTFELEVDQIPGSEPFITNVVRIDYPPTVDDWGDVISDPVRSDNVFTHVMPLNAVYWDWDIVKTAEPPSTVVVGETRPVITYTIRYTYTGNVTDTGSVWITDVVDIDYLEIITYSSPGLVKQTGNTLVWTDNAEEIGPQEGRVVSFTVWVTRPLPHGTQFGNQASISSQSSLVETSEWVTHTVASAPVLSILKNASPSSGSAVRPDSTIAYTLTVANTGGVNATSTVITDTFDSDYLGHLSYSEGGALVGSDTITWTAALLPVDTPWVVTFTAQVSNVTDVTITNRAEVDCTERPVVQSNVVKHFVPAVPVLSIEKDDGRVEVAAGEVLTYQVSFANYGVISATGVRITDTFPTSVVEPYGPNAGWNDCGDGCRYYDYAGTLTDTIQTIAFTVQVLQAAPLGPFTNTVSIAAEDDAIPDTGTDVDTVILQPNVTISKSDGRTTVNPGEYLTYTIQCDNADSVDHSIVLTEVLPSEVRYVGSGWQPAGSDTYTRSLTVSAEGNETLLLFVQVDPGAAESTVLENTVTMYGGPYVSFPGGDHDTDTTTVNGLRDLTVYKSDGVDGVNPGQRITYTIVYANLGTLAVDNVRITDTLPAETDWEPGSSSCGSGWMSVGASQFRAEVGTVNGGATGQCQMVAIVKSGAGDGFINNTVQIGGDQDEDDWTNNEFTDTDHVYGNLLADLYVVTLSSTPVTPTVGSGTNFAAMVTNLGPGPAEDILATPEASLAGEPVIATFRLPLPSDFGMGAEADGYCDSIKDVVYLGLYIDPYRTPVRPDSGWWDGVGYFYLPLNAGDSATVNEWLSPPDWQPLAYPFTAPGWYQIFVQVDLWDLESDQCGWGRTFGHIPETNETNNIASIMIWVEEANGDSGGVYLPAIMKNF